ASIERKRGNTRTETGETESDRRGGLSRSSRLAAGRDRESPPDLRAGEAIGPVRLLASEVSHGRRGGVTGELTGKDVLLSSSQRDSTAPDHTRHSRDSAPQLILVSNEKVPFLLPFVVF